jgi:hypothetical protein
MTVPTQRVRKRSQPSEASSSKRSKMAAVPLVQAATTTSFFSLPRELRDEIYDHLWKSKAAFNVFYDGYEYKVHYSNTGYQEDWNGSGVKAVKSKRYWRNSSASSWLFTNRQFLMEGAEQFLRQCTWTSVTSDKGTPARPSKLSGNNINMSTAPTHIAASRNKYFLLSPWKARVLRMESQQLVRLFDMDQHGSAIIRIDLATHFVPPFRSLHAAIPEHPQLLRLEIVFAFRNYEDASDAMALIEVDFRPLRALCVPTLRSVGMVVDFQNGVGREENTALYSSLKDGLSALGSGLVGGDGKEELTMLDRPEWARGPLWTLEMTQG